MTGLQQLTFWRTDPLRVAVHGLPGVGVSTLLPALSEFTVAEEDPDVTVRVVAETVKPEDLRALAGAPGPALVVLTKADTCALGPGGPLETARRRCRELTARAGVPAEPVVGLLAHTMLGAAELDTLRALVGAPADLRTAEVLVSAPHPVPAADRRRLVDALDLFGIAHAVVALRERPSSTAADLGAVLRRVSGIEAVLARIVALGAESRYRRLRAVLGEVETAAITDADAAELLASDDVMMTRMTAACEVLRAAGLSVDPSDHLMRARYWRRYGAGPVSALHRDCASDIVAGSLRLWSPAGV